MLNEERLCGMKRKLFEELKRSVREAGRIERGEMKSGRVTTIAPKSGTGGAIELGTLDSRPYISRVSRVKKSHN